MFSMYFDVVCDKLTMTKLFVNLANQDMEWKAYKFLQHSALQNIVRELKMTAAHGVQPSHLEVVVKASIAHRLFHSLLVQP